jgi:predicted Zn finger-like uncharacterized protein
MQLTCPNCKARYNVTEEAVPPSGRTARCAACGTSWLAKPPVATASAGKPSKAEVEAKLAEAKKAAKLEPHEVARRKARGQIKLVNGIAAAIPWLLAACFLIGAIGASIIYRSDIVRLWPKTATVFAKLGVPANLYGVDIQSVTVTTTLEANGPRIEVKGVLKSVSRRAEFVPYLKLSLVDPAGREKLSWMIDPGIEVLQPGVAHRFSSARTNPVRGPLNAVLVFAEPPRKGSAPTLLPPPSAETAKPAAVSNTKAAPSSKPKEAPIPAR